MATSTQFPTVDPVHSEFSSDPEYRELLEMFVSEMPNRRTALERAYLRWDVAQLRVQAHQLKGSAGGYGFGGLSSIAGTLEDACERNDPSEVAANLRQTLDYLSRISV